jgi:hypothetical protein
MLVKQNLLDMSHSTVTYSRRVGHVPDDNRLSFKVDVVTEMTAGHDKPSPRSGDEMANARKLPDKKLLGFPALHGSVEMKLLGWIRGVLQSNDQLVEALEHLRRSYKVLQTGKSVPDAAEILWQVELALSDAQRSRNALALKSSQGPGRG